MQMKIINKEFILAFFFALYTLNISAGSTGSQFETPAARDSVSAFIRSLQYTSGSAAGAFKKSQSPAYRVGGTGAEMFFVEPYFTHIACMALLEEGGPENIAAVEGWMNWYIGKVGENPNSCPDAPLMMNYFYDAAGGSETTSAAEMGDAFSCTIDAEDSDPALFFMLAYRYFKATDNDAWFQETGVRGKLESFVNFLYDELYDSATGLTSAKRTWPLKYTMDNSEVYAGMKAFVGIMDDVYGETASSEVARATTMMNTTQTNIISLKMYPSGTPTSYNDFKLFGSTDCCDGYLDGQRMYDFTPILWPVLFGIDTDFDSDAANYIRDLINETMQGWNQPAWYMNAAAGGFWDNSVGYFFSMSADSTYQEAGKAQAVNAVNESFKSDSMGAESFISDAGWLLLNLQAMAGEGVELYNY